MKLSLRYLNKVFELDWCSCLRILVWAEEFLGEAFVFLPECEVVPELMNHSSWRNSLPGEVIVFHLDDYRRLVYFIVVDSNSNVVGFQFLIGSNELLEATLGDEWRRYWRHITHILSLQDFVLYPLQMFFRVSLIYESRYLGKVHDLGPVFWFKL